MNPLWNSPSLGTFRTGETRLGIFLVMVFGWIALVPLWIVAPLLAVAWRAWDKKPSAIWRSAFVATMLATAALILPVSPLFVGMNVPFSVPQTPNDGWNGFVGYYLTPWVNLALVAEIPLLPLAIATTIHSRLTEKTEESSDSSTLS